MTRPHRRTALFPLLCSLSLALLVAGCTPDPDGDADPGATGARSPFTDCAKLTTPLSGTPASADGPDRAGAAGAPLPAVTLSCFTGGAPVEVGALRGPAVVNLWASWCAPCREELPVLQRLADRSAGSVRVVGVDVRDRADSARSLGSELGITFAQLADPEERLLRALERPFVPVTLLVDADGRIRHVDESGRLDDATLAGLVRRHLGVAVAP